MFLSIFISCLLVQLLNKLRSFSFYFLWEEAIYPKDVFNLNWDEVQKNDKYIKLQNSLPSFLLHFYIVSMKYMKKVE